MRTSLEFLCGLDIQKLKQVLEAYTDRTNCIPNEVYIKHDDTFYHVGRIIPGLLDFKEKGDCIVLETGSRLITDEKELKERDEKLRKELKEWGESWGKKE